MTHGRESSKQNVMTYLSKTTAEVAWPSSKSLFYTNFTFSSLTSLFFFFFRRPSCQRSRFHGAHLLQNVSLRSRLFPGGHERQTTYSCKLMISGWVPCSCRVDYSDKRRVCDQLSRSHRAGIKKKERKKSTCGWERVVFVCSDSAAVNDDARRLVWSHRWQALVAYARLFFALFPRRHSLSVRRAGTFTFHLGDDRQHAVHSLLHHSPGGTYGCFYVSLHAQTHSQVCTQNAQKTRVGLAAFSQRLSRSWALTIARQWKQRSDGLVVCVCACVCGTERERGFPLHQKLPELLLKT